MLFGFRWTRAAALAAVVAFGGCAGDALRAPAVTVTQGGSWGEVTLTFDDCDRVDGCDLEASVGGGPWFRVNFKRLKRGPYDATLADRISELDVVEFRARAFDGEESATGPVVPYVVPPHTPGELLVRVPVGSGGSTRIGGAALSWTDTSAAATKVRIVRHDAGSGAVERSFLEGGATAWSDPAAEDGREYRYEVSYGAAGAWSPPAIAHAGVDLLAPEDVVAEHAETGVRVRWLLRSTTATGVRITARRGGRLDREEIVLPPSAREWLDPYGPHWPANRYVVAAVRDEVVAAAPEVLPGPYRLEAWSALEAGASTGPGAESVALDAAGSRHFAGYLGARARIWRPAPGGWDAHDLEAPGRPVRPGVAVDGDGRTHTVLMAPEGDHWTLTHAWWDGQGWIEEPVLDAPIASFPNGDLAWFGAAPQVRVAWAPGAFQPARLATRAAGGWAFEDAPALGVAGFETAEVLDVAFGPDGAAHVLLLGSVASGGRCVVQTRSTAGAWSEREVTACSEATTIWGWLAAADGGRVDAVLLRQGPVADLAWVRDTGGAFAEPEVLHTTAVTNDVRYMAVSMSADGASRAALFVDVAANPGVTLLAVGGDAGWRRVVLGPGWPLSGGLSHAPDGRVRVFARFSWIGEDLDAGWTPWAIFQER